MTKSLDLLSVNTRKNCGIKAGTGEMIQDILARFAGYFRDTAFIL
jgi:hypothetical protein